MALAEGPRPPEAVSGVVLASIPERLGPCVDQPLRGCVELAKIALVGETAILEEALRPVPWSWDGVWARSTVLYLAGPPGGGKTTLLFLLSVCLMADRPTMLLNRMVTPMDPGQVLVLVEGEHGPGSTSRKLVAACTTMGLSTAVLDRVVILARKSVLIGDGRWGEVVRMIAAGVVGCVAIDTLGRCAPSDSNSEQEQTRVFELLVRAIEAGPIVAGTGPEPREPVSRQPGMVVLGHVKKGQGTYDVEDVSGSAARAGQADTIGLVIPNKEDAVIRSTTVYWPKVRDGDEPALPVTYEIRARVLSLVDRPSKKADGVDADALCSLVGEVPGRSGNWLAKEMGKRKETVLATLQSLKSAGRVRRAGEGWILSSSVGNDVPF